MQMIMYFWVCFVIILMVDGVYKTATIVNNIAAVWLYSTCFIFYAIFTIRMFLDINECV